jgi:hypothetical protein
LNKYRNMRYKIVKKTAISNDKPVNLYYVMYEKKVWWKKEPVWRYCREYTYSSQDSFFGDPVKRYSLTEAEDYINIQMRIGNNEFAPEDVKIYECRDSKLNKILK